MAGTERPLLSLCIPTYNRADWLRVSLMALAPAVQQAAGLIEVVVTDNASPDDGRTKRVVEEAQALFPVNYHRHPANIGMNPNLRYTVSEHARGEYAWVIGDDDVVCNDGLLRTVAALQAHPELDIVFVNHLDYHGKQPIGGEVAPDSISIYCTDFQDRYLPRLSDLLPVEPNCFTAIYSFVLRRTLSAQAFVADTVSAPFTSVQTVVPHAVWIIKNLLHRPAYYLGQPGLIASAEISWRKFRAQYGLVLMHDLYDLLQAQGANADVIDAARRSRLRFTAGLLWEMLNDSATGLRETFSLWDYMTRHGRYPELWATLQELTQHAQADVPQRRAA